MHQGLAMPLEERQARHQALLAQIRVTSARQFCLTFLAALQPDAEPAATLPRKRELSHADAG